MLGARILDRQKKLYEHLHFDYVDRAAPTIALYLCLW